MNITRLLFAFVAVMLVTACATQPVAPSAAKRISSDRVYDALLTTPAPGRTEVRFIRDVGFRGSGVKAVISLRGREIGALGTGEVFSIYVDPGIYTFSMLKRPNLFGYEVPNILRIDDGVVQELVSEGIIYRSASLGNMLEGFAHNIGDIAWDYLHVYPNLLEGTTNTYRTDKRRRGMW